MALFPPQTNRHAVVTGNVGGIANGWVASDASLTRPANATAYAAHKAIGSASSVLFTWSNFFAAKNQTGWLTGLRLVASVASIATSNMGQVRGHLYKSSPSSPPSADQQDFTLLVANVAKKLGYVDFSTWNIGASGSDMIESFGLSVVSPFLPIQADADDTDLHAIFEATAAFTPIASAIITPYAAAVLD